VFFEHSGTRIQALRRKKAFEGRKVEKVRKNDFFFAGMQKITTFACLFGEMP
jgi:hypothetical protein